MASPILSLININKKISDNFQLSNISADFYPGEVCAVIGENGSGKSSLMKVISGILTPDSGEILFNNKPVAFKSIYDAKKQGIYYVPQESNLFDNLTVAENIFIDSVSHRYNLYEAVNTNEVLHNAGQLLEELNINMEVEEYVKNLNLSQKQILSFVKAYVINARFTIFDEPASSLTDIENATLFKIIDLLKANGSSIILISHKLERIMEIGDKVIILKDGSIIEKGSIKDYTNESIIKIMSKSTGTSKFPKLYFDNKDEILSLSNISYKRFLKDISFSMKKQEILGVIGNSGSGKDKLIRILFGLLKPDSGEIKLEGSNIDLTHPKDAMDKGFGLVPEDKIRNSIFHQLDLVNNLTMSSLGRFTRNIVLDDYIMTNVAENYISKLRISPGNPDDRAIHYSGGNQQKVAFAKSIMHLAKIYILDEPTRGIDIVSKNDIYNIMNNLLINGSSIILFSSDFDEILGMSDRILILSDGRIVAEVATKYTNKEEIIYYLTK